MRAAEISLAASDFGFNQPGQCEHGQPVERFGALWFRGVRQQDFASFTSSLPGENELHGNAAGTFEFNLLRIPDVSRVRKDLANQRGVFLTHQQIEIDQTSPFWAFQDGNISWHLRFLKGPPNGPVPGQNNGQPGKSTDLYATESGLLVRYPDLIAPPNNGIVPGMELGGLGTFRDIRYPWGFGEVATLDFEVEGPGILVFFASVKQTNPATRQQIGNLGLTVAQRAQLLREEQFIAAFPNAIYRHVSGAILCEFGQLNRRPGINPTQGETPCG